MKLQSIERTPNGKKEFKAVFKKTDGKTKTTRFGTASNFALNPKKTEQDKNAYKARHNVRENWSDPTSAGSLSKHILWGNSRSVKSNTKDFKNKFNL